MTMNEWHAKLDELWGDFWPATELRQLAVVDFINCIFFVRKLHETETTTEKVDSFYTGTREQTGFSPAHSDLRWSSFQLLDEHRLYLLFNKKDGVLDFVKNTEAYGKLEKFDEEGEDLKPLPELLAKTVSTINCLDVADEATRNVMNEYLLSKAAAETKKRELELSASSMHRINPKPERERGRFPNVSILLLLFFLIAFGATFFYFQYRKPNASLNRAAAIQDSSKQNDTLLVLASKKDNAKKATKVAGKKTKQRNTVEHKTVKGKKESSENKSISKAEAKGLYKIISKAYFHNEPDEATRRDAFVVHWNNSYARLKAHDEKNGFIYVVFHNHLNQTSKGWLRKKDLEPIGE